MTDPGAARTELTARLVGADGPCRFCDASAVVEVAAAGDGDRRLPLCRSCTISLRAATGEAVLLVLEARSAGRPPSEALLY